MFILRPPVPITGDGGSALFPAAGFLVSVNPQDLEPHQWETWYIALRNEEERVDTLTCMRTFGKIVEVGSFAGAARALGMSPATVTKHVQHLERRLRARLFNRNPHHVRLTDAGLRYARHCDAMLIDLGQIEAEVGEAAQRPEGRFRISAAYDFGVSILEPAVLEFVQGHPGIEVDLQLSQRLVNLAEDEIDLAVRCMAKPRESDLVIRRLAASRLVACAAPAYLRAHGTPAAPRELRTHNCLIYTGTSWRDVWPFARDGSVEKVRVAGNIRSNDNHLLRKAATAGLGITIQPTFNIWRELKERRLEPVLRGWDIEELGVYVVFPEKRYLPGKVRAFVDFLARYFEGKPDWEVN